LSHTTLWRRKYPEKYEKWYKKYQEEHKRETLERIRKWRKNNKEKYNASQKRWREKNKERLKLYHKKRRLEQRKKLLEALGDNCMLCGFKESKGRKIQFHEIYGSDHPYNKGVYILEHKDDFVPLCHKCHNFIHIFGRSDGNIDKLVELCNWVKRYTDRELYK